MQEKIKINELTLNKILHLVSISLSVVAIVLSIVAISKSPKEFVRKNRLHLPNQIRNENVLEDNEIQSEKEFQRRYQNWSNFKQKRKKY